MALFSSALAMYKRMFDFVTVDVVAMFSLRLWLFWGLFPVVETPSKHYGLEKIALSRRFTYLGHIMDLKV